MDILSKRIGLVLANAKASVVRDLTPATVEAALSGLEAGPNTASKYKKAIKSMLRWAVREGRLEASPLEGLVCPESKDSGQKRRALTNDERGRLLAAAIEGPARRAMRMVANRPGADGTFKKVAIPGHRMGRLREEGVRMRTLYLIMLETGLRTNEVRSLCWRHLDLDAGTLSCRREWTKNGQDCVLPMSAVLKAALGEWRAIQKPATGEEPVIPRISRRTLIQFDDDLEAAGIEKIDARGEVVCMHSLRHTFATRLVASGVDIKTTQELMRHSSPEITLALYAHTDMGRMRRAVDSLHGAEAIKQ